MADFAFCKGGRSCVASRQDLKVTVVDNSALSVACEGLVHRRHRQDGHSQSKHLQKAGLVSVMLEPQKCFGAYI